MDLNDLLTIIKINNEIQKCSIEFYEASSKIIGNNLDKKIMDLYYIKGEEYLNIFDCIAISIHDCNLPENVIKAHFSIMLISTIQSFLDMGKPFSDMVNNRESLCLLYAKWLNEKYKNIRVKKRKCYDK